MTPSFSTSPVIPLDRVSRILSVVKAQQLLTVIDACRNNTAKDKSEEDNLLNDDFTKGFKIRRSSSGSGKPSVSKILYPCNGPGHSRGCVAALCRDPGGRHARIV